MGALRARGPKADLVGDLLALGDADACMSRLKSLFTVEENVDTSDRRATERALRGMALVFARKIATFLGGRARGVLEAYLVRYQVENLTALMRHSLEREDASNTPVLYPVKPFHVSEREMALLDSPEKVIALARRGPLRAMAKEAYDAFQAGGNDIFRFELSLDRQCLHLLWNASGRLGPLERARLRKRILLPYVGMNAFLWALWLQKYHGMGGQELANTLQPPKSIMSPKALIDIAQAESAADTVRAVRGPLRPVVAEILKMEPQKDVARWQRASRRIIWRAVGRREVGSAFDISAILAMVMHWEIVIDDLITVTNGKFLGMEREKIEELLATKVAS